MKLFAVVLWAAIVLAQLTIVGGVIYLAVHFAIKYW